MNADNIKKHINDLIQDVNILKKKNRDPKKLLSNYSFEGAPGTGKSTVARAFGTVFHSLGLLSSADVVECKAMELIGEYVGHSGARMRYDSTHHNTTLYMQIVAFNYYDTGIKQNLIILISLQRQSPHTLNSPKQKSSTVWCGEWRHNESQIMRVNFIQ